MIGVRIGDKVSEFTVISDGSSVSTEQSGFDFENEGGMTLYLEHDQAIEEGKEVALVGTFVMKDGISFSTDTLNEFKR